MKKILTSISLLFLTSNSFACFNVNPEALEEKASRKIEKYKSIIESSRYVVTDYIHYLEKTNAKNIPQKLATNKRFLLNQFKYQAECAKTVLKDFNHLLALMNIFCEHRLTKKSFNENLLIQSLQKLTQTTDCLDKRFICSVFRLLEKIKENKIKYKNPANYPYLSVDISLFAFLKPIIDHYKEEIDRYVSQSIILPGEESYQTEPLVVYIDGYFRKSGYLQLQSLIDTLHKSYNNLSRNTLPHYRFFEGSPELIIESIISETIHSVIPDSKISDPQPSKKKRKKRGRKKIQVTIDTSSDSPKESGDIEVPSDIKKPEMPKNNEEITSSTTTFVELTEKSNISIKEIPGEVFVDPTTAEFIDPITPEFGDSSITESSSPIIELSLKSDEEDEVVFEENRWWLGYELEKKLQAKRIREQRRSCKTETLLEISRVERTENEEIDLILETYSRNQSFELLSHILKPGKLKKLTELNWKTQVTRLLSDLGAEIKEDSSGSRNKVMLNGLITVFHTHGTIGMDTINGHLRDFLIQALGKNL